MSPDRWQTLGLLVLAALAVAAVAVARSLARRIRRLRFAQLSEAELMRGYLDAQDVAVRLDADDLAYLSGRVVAVVGAGGSIASELCLQLGALDVARLVLIDNNENGLYRLGRVLAERIPSRGARISTELANVRDRARLQQIFDEHRPQVVFHYANYKSAALGNLSPYAFVKVNVGGTRSLLDAATSTGCLERFVYISSDKAQSASQTYGRTKRVCELLVSATARSTGGSPDGPGFASLRYCNVLDAAGSFAIPTFRQQILAGHRITIRRLPDGAVPDRYFVTIRTAAQLALRVGGLARHGEIFSLDAARIDPIRMDDVVRRLAHAYGIRRVEGWCRRRVSFVPAEAGEKLSESLGSGQPVPHAPLVEIDQADQADLVDVGGLLGDVDALLVRATREQQEQVSRRLRELVRRREPDGVPAYRVAPSSDSVGVAESVARG